MVGDAGSVGDVRLLNVATMYVKVLGAVFRRNQAFALSKVNLETNSGEAVAMMETMRQTRLPARQ